MEKKTKKEGDPKNAKIISDLKSKHKNLTSLFLAEKNLINEENNSLKEEIEKNNNYLGSKHDEIETTKDFIKKERVKLEKKYHERFSNRVNFLNNKLLQIKNHIHELNTLIEKPHLKSVQKNINNENVQKIPNGDVVEHQCCISTKKNLEKEICLYTEKHSHLDQEYEEIKRKKNIKSENIHLLQNKINILKSEIDFINTCKNYVSQDEQAQNKNTHDHLYHFIEILKNKEKILKNKIIGQQNKLKDFSYLASLLVESPISKIKFELEHISTENKNLLDITELNNNSNEIDYHINNQINEKLTNMIQSEIERLVISRAIENHFITREINAAMLLLNNKN